MLPVNILRRRDHGEIADFLWPYIHDPATARAAAGRGTIAAVLWSGVTLALDVAARNGWVALRPVYAGLDTHVSTLAAAALFTGIAVGIARLSRVAALLGLALCLAALLVLLLNVEAVSRLVFKVIGSVNDDRFDLAVVAFPLVTTLMFLSGVRGAFAHHHYGRWGVAAPVELQRLPSRCETCGQPCAGGFRSCLLCERRVGGPPPA